MRTLANIPNPFPSGHLVLTLTRPILLILSNKGNSHLHSLFDSSFQNPGVSLMQNRSWASWHGLYLPWAMLWALGRESLGTEVRNTSSVPTELHGARGETAAMMAPRLTSSLMAGGHFPVLAPGTPGATAFVRSWDIQPDSRLPDSNIIKHTRLDRNSYLRVSRVSTQSLNKGPGTHKPHLWSGNRIQKEAAQCTPRQGQFPQHCSAINPQAEPSCSQGLPLSVIFIRLDYSKSSSPRSLVAKRVLWSGKQSSIIQICHIPSPHLAQGPGPTLTVPTEPSGQGKSLRFGGRYPLQEPPGSATERSSFLVCTQATRPLPVHCPRRSKDLGKMERNLRDTASLKGTPILKTLYYWMVTTL